MKKTAVFQTTNRCGYKCTVCPYSTTHALEPYQEMSMELFKNIINIMEVEEKCSEIAFGYNYDCMTDPMLEERLNFVNNYSFPDITLSTIGLQHSQKLQEIIKSGVLTGFVISIVGGENFEKITGYSLKEQIDNVYTINKIANKYKTVMGIKIASYNPLRSSQYFENIFPKALFNVSFSSLCTRLGKIAGSHKKVVAKDDFYNRIISDECSIGNLFINVDGKISLCCQDWGKQFIIGDLTKDHQINKHREVIMKKTIEKDYCSRCFQDILIEPDDY